MNVNTINNLRGIEHQLVLCFVILLQQNIDRQYLCDII